MLENSDERLAVRQPWGRRGPAVLPDDPQIGQVLRDRAEDAVQVARLLHIEIYRGLLGAGVQGGMHGGAGGGRAAEVDGCARGAKQRQCRQRKQWRQASVTPRCGGWRDWSRSA